ncbi:MAG TPA: hypothetical protein V6D19_23200 [Stenomitos sp.]
MRKSSKYIVVSVGLLYGLYLLKTALGVNLSNQYSAPMVFKLPIKPLWANKAELCSDHRSICAVRHQLRNKIEYRIQQLKNLV